MDDVKATRSEQKAFSNKLVQQLNFIYKEINLAQSMESLSEDLIKLMNLEEKC